MNNGFTILAGTANPGLAAAVARNLGIEVGACVIDRFPDSEVMVQLREPVRRKEVFLGRFGNVVPPMFALFAGAQLRPEVSGQREFSMIQCRRLPHHEFRHLDVLIDLAD